MSYDVRKIVRFSANRQGAVAVVFALSALPLAAIIGASIDYAGMIGQRARLQQAVDAGALAAASSGAGAQQQSVAEQIVNAHANAQGITLSSLAVSNPTSTTVKVDAVGTRPTTFGRLLGTSMATLRASATASFSSTPGASGGSVDIGMMLDVSGSMKGARFDGLKAAVRDALDVLIGSGSVSSTIRIGFAPYSSSLNAGSYASSLTGRSSSNNCVGDRAGANVFSDAPPNADFFDVDGTYAISDDATKAYEVRAFKGYGTPYFDVSTVCPRAEIFPLSGDYGALSNQLDTFQPAGITAGHVGMQFAWYLISDKWASFWPLTSKPGSKSTTQKYVVLMTDGEFNAYFRLGNGLPNVQGTALCDGMKADGVTIFAVSFDNNGDSADMLKACASKPSYFFKPTDTAALQQAFHDIANSIKSAIPATALPVRLAR